VSHPRTDVAVTAYTSGAHLYENDVILFNKVLISSEKKFEIKVEMLL
jgi:hypothetical protein